MFLLYFATLLQEQKRSRVACFEPLPRLLLGKIEQIELKVINQELPV